ncbi:MAG TPA: DUF4926 domain-containing protein [Humisphaera sp.]|nr:DUF4926 domain-containing protein [Humisphaera sp.]
MKDPSINDSVRLIQDVPRHLLHKDQVGIVCSIWHAPECFEVEFRRPDEDENVRVLLSPEQFRVESYWR